MNLLESLGLGPKAPEGNVVFYAVYADDITPDSLSLEAYRMQMLDMLRPHLHGYLWHKDCFDLSSTLQQQLPWVDKRRGSLAEPPYLWGALRYGDNVEDEWFVVWLLLHLTAQLPGSSARVWDDDGEFLLIEAAYSLPKWLKPESSGNRVWLRQGRVQLLPMPGGRLLDVQQAGKAAVSGQTRLASGDVPAFPTAIQALDLLRQGVVAAEGTSIDSCIQARLQGYPGKAKQQMHRAACVLPLRVAHILRHEPQLVAAAVEAFCYRTAEDTRTAARMQHFPPDEMIPAIVQLNRCMYAQLKQAYFHPPKGYAMPLPSDPAHAAADLGLKLTTGFEIVYAQGAQQRAKRQRSGRAAAGSAPGTGAAATPGCSSASGASSSGVAMAGTTAAAESSEGVYDPAQLEGHQGWHAYVQLLQQRGVFEGELQGSARYRQLLAAAADAFCRTQAYHSSIERLSEPVRRMDEILQVVPDRQELLAAAHEREDDDGWLLELSQQLDMELDQRQKEMGAQAARPPRRAGLQDDDDDDEKLSSGDESWEEDSEAGGMDAAELAQKFQSFMAKVSSYEGAEVPQDTGGINFNAEAFLSELHSVLGVSGQQQPVMGGEEDTSEEGSSFYSDSAESESDDGELTSDGEDEGARSARFVYGRGPGSGQSTGAAGQKVAGAEVHTTAAQQPQRTFTAHTAPKAAGAQSSEPATMVAATPSGTAPHQTSSPGTSVGSGGTAGKQASVAPLASTSAPSTGLPLPTGADLEMAWEVQTATDSDDDLAEGSETGSKSDAGHQDFMEAYGAAMEAELGGTAMARTFQEAAGDAPTQPAAPEPAGLQPVDVDLNLVRSMLESYTSQQGLPGPAGNLAGLLGLQLPVHRTRPAK